MKKYLIAVVVLLLVMTGCGNTKKLTCTLEKEKSKEVLTFNYKKDELVKVEGISTIYANKEVNEEDLALYGEFTCSLLGDEEYIDCSIEPKGKNVEITITMDLENLTDAELEEMGYAKENSSYEEMKKDAEADGYTCK